MDLLHLMATTHPTRVMEATVGARARRPSRVRRADARTPGSRLRAALTGRVTPERPAGVCVTC